MSAPPPVSAPLPVSALLPVYPRLPLQLVSASGCWLQTSDGRSLLDLYGGHAVSPLGHGHPELHRALLTAHSTLDFYSNSVHMPIQERAAAAVLAGSEHLGWAHFVNSGTEANEAALHLARRRTGRASIHSFSCSFHGRTLGTLAATGLPGYRQRLSVDVPAPWHRTIEFGSYDDLDLIDETVAAVLCESIPSIAGVLMPPPGWYPRLAARCKQVGALLIFDEVQGGVGRTGHWFAHDLLGVEPDLVTLAKGLGGGFPVGAVLGTEALARWVQPGEIGTTFGGGPMACAMVCAVAEVIERDQLMRRNVAIFARIKSSLELLPGVTVRGAGTLIGVETPLPASELRTALLERNVLVGSSGEPNTVRLLPPYVLTDDELDIGITAIREALGAAP